uniref:Perilipin n=1 Tax=Gadus morhua TaxID=8049 RepID=A0A8C4ZS34_GADMO
MADSGKANEVGTEAAQPANAEQGLVSRVSNLPLVSSACGAVSSAYTSTKDSVPLLKGVMDVAETGVRTLGAAASTGSKPLLDMLEPQITAVSDYALMGLDKMEATLPILQQPADKLVSDTVGRVYQSVTGARDAVTGARDAVTGAVMGAVMGGVELTKAAVSGGVSTVMSSRLGQMASSGVGLALSRSETWVEQNLPLSERELAALAEPAPGAVSAGVTPPAAAASYFVRLGALSTAVRERAMEHSLSRARRARDATYATATQITSTLDLLEGARSTLGTAGLQVEAGGEGREVGVLGPERLEGRALAMVHGLTDQLQAACSGVVSSAQGLPANIQAQLDSARQSAADLRSSLGSSSTLTPLLLEQCRSNLTKVQQSVDGVMDYLIHNTPLNWLVGPFAPQITEKEAAGAEQKPSVQP